MNKIIYSMKRLAFIWLLAVLSLFSIQSSATIFPAGSVIIDMGNSTPTVANTLKGYGLIYSLLKWKSVPINCIVNTSKAKDGIDFTVNTTVYGSTPGAVTSRSFYAGCYVISAEYITASVKTTLDSTGGTKWGSVGKYYISTAIDLPVSYTIKYAPRWVLNNENTAISEGFFTDAGIPITGTSSAVSYKLPATLGACDDIFVMPHSDPTWATHQNLLAWNDTYNGAIWAGCHAVSVFENLSNGTGGVGGTSYMNFLTTVPSPLATISNSSNNRGLRHYNEDPLGNHDDGSAPFSNAYPTDPVYQYRGTIDAAISSGSEQIYFPKRSSTWNPGAKVGVWDPTPPTATDNIWPGSGSNRSGGVGAINVYGRGFDNASRGYVMYQSGHDIGGTAVGNVNAERLFFNFSFFAGVDKVAITQAYAAFTSAPPSTMIQGTTSGTLSINGGVALPAGYTVKWTSTVAGGTFSNSTGVSTTYTAPTNVSCLQQDIITATVTDPCGRTAFDSKGVSLIATGVPVVTPGSQVTFCSGGSVTLSSSYSGAGNQWYKDGVAIGGATNQTYSATTSGVYTVVYTNPSTSCPTLNSTGITVLVSCFNITGNVWIDANRDAIKSGGEVNYTGGGLNAILVDGSGNVAESVVVNGSGNFTITKLPESVSGYKIIISTTAGTVGAAAPAIALPLPAGPNAYVTTGENNSGTAETGGLANSTILLSPTTTALSNLNFGIQQRPEGADYTAASQVNPGGSTTVPVPVAAFTGTDPEDGTYTAGLSGRTVRLTPATNGTLYYNGVAITSNTDFPGFNPALVTIDPTGNGAVTPTFQYRFFDNANFISGSFKTITLPFTDLTISGKVWNDGNGTTNNVIDGTGIGSPASTTPITQLYVNLVSGSNVISSVAVAANGTYSFGNANGITANTNYSLVLSTTQGTIGQPVASVLPSGWVHTAQGSGTGDGTATDGLKTLSVVTSVISSDIDFGIDQIPVGSNYTASSQVNPGGSNTVVVPSAAFTGTDAEDGTYTTGLSGRTVRLSAATNGTLYYNGVAVNSATDFSSFNPALVTLDPGNGAITSSFNYQVYDNAGVVSVAKAINMPFTDLTVSGKVWDDGNGTNNSLIDGTGIGSPASTPSITQLYVNAVSGGLVLGSIPVNSDGTYTLGTASGIKINTNFNLVLSSTQGTIGQPVASVLPSGWVHTAQTSGVGDGTASDGLLSVAVAGAVISTNVDFGIEKAPVGNDFDVDAQVNPGYAVKVPVPVIAFTGSDAEDAPSGYTPGLSGQTVTITSGNNGKLYYNNIEVTANQKIVGFDPALVSFDPNDGTVIGSFGFIIFDVFDVASVQKTITLPFTEPAQPSVLSLQLKVLLQGATLGNGVGFESTMRDNLRNSLFTGLNYIPTSDPYTNNADYNTKFTKVGDGLNSLYQTVTTPSTLFLDYGTASAVDWVFIELRSKLDSTIVLGTRSAIVLRNGTVVDVDGSTCIKFPSLTLDNYFVAVRHRTHLGTMTSTALNTSYFNCTTVIDFTTMTNSQLWHNPATPQYDGLEMATLSDGKRALWAANSNVDVKVKYQGGGNDRTTIQSDVLGFGTNINFDNGYGYFKGDVNMDSKSKYQGSGNDRTLLQSIVLGYLLNTLNVNFDFFLQQLP